MTESINEQRLERSLKTKKKGASSLNWFSGVSGPAAAFFVLFVFVETYYAAFPVNEPPRIALLVAGIGVIGLFFWLRNESPKVVELTEEEAKYNLTKILDNKQRVGELAQGKTHIGILCYHKEYGVKVIGADTKKVPWLSYWVLTFTLRENDYLTRRYTCFMYSCGPRIGTPKGFIEEIDEPRDRKDVLTKYITVDSASAYAKYNKLKRGGK